MFASALGHRAGYFPSCMLVYGQTELCEVLPCQRDAVIYHGNCIVRSSAEIRLKGQCASLLLLCLVHRRQR